MLFGHNSNVAVGSDVVHVQTEDRGAAHAVIDTTVHWKGRVLHRRTNRYLDLLPLDAEREVALKGRIDEQHRAVIEEIRSGALPLALQVTAPADRVTAPLKIELINAKSWLVGKVATLKLRVSDAQGAPVGGAHAGARIEGVDAPLTGAKTGSEGAAILTFEMPPLGGVDAALVIEASLGGAKGQLRFQLRARPRA